ncbi:unnamed protein product [Effrenium voratum]|uniref:MHD domain-containing protein n=1 Tax=Effrenium voratum TaxID=2562239 RepID=A0AA36J7P4_9DINO|nr:unnamed protein product [Effrenium voratum]CAJ1422044.1 unnamed protein product [Effrenium voratum]
MACQLRALWVFHLESEVRLLTSRRFPTVERKLQRLQGDSHVPLPCDEDISHLFISEVLEEQEDHTLPPDLPEPFHEDFRQGSFSWDPTEESRVEKLWPMGPMTALMKGKIWPVVFLHKKGYYLVTAVAIMERSLGKRGRSDSNGHGVAAAGPGERACALELPQVTAAFAVLEDICDFIPASLSISDVTGISELQYYIRSALPFGSPVNTNFHLLRMVRSRGKQPHVWIARAKQHSIAQRHGFPNKEDDTSQRSPAWKPYLYKGKSKLTLSVVETINCTLYGKSEYHDECFIQGTVYCCADIAGVPEVCVPISFQAVPGAAPVAVEAGQDTAPVSPEISVHNCAHIIGGIKSAKEDSLKISCQPPTGPFVLCRYNFRQSPVVPVRGFYQLKELSPVEFRLLLQVQLHPLVSPSSGGSWNCQVRLPFDHRGVIRSHDLKCTCGSFSLADHSRSIVWNLNVRRPRGTLEANLLGELIFEAPQKVQQEQQIKREQQPQQQQQQLQHQQKPSQQLQPQQPQPQQPLSSQPQQPQQQQGQQGQTQQPTGQPAQQVQAAQPAQPQHEADAQPGDVKEGSQPEGAALAGEEGDEPKTAESCADDAAAARSGVDMLLAAGIAHAEGAASQLEEEQDMEPSLGVASEERPDEGGKMMGAPHQLQRAGQDTEAERGQDEHVGLAATSLVIAAVGAPAKAALTPSLGSTQGAAPTVSTSSAPSNAALTAPDPFLMGVNCYAEVFLEVPDVALSGINIDPKAVTVYPTTRVYGGVAVQKEFLTGKYIIWNMAGEVRGHYNGLEFDAET